MISEEKQPHPTLYHTIISYPTTLMSNLTKMVYKSTPKSSNTDVTRGSHPQFTGIVAPPHTTDTSSDSLLARALQAVEFEMAHETLEVRIRDDVTDTQDR